MQSSRETDRKDSMNKTYLAIKKILLALLAAFLLFRVVWINAAEIRLGSHAPQTAAAGRYRDITYFQDFSLETFDGGVFTEEDLKAAEITVVNAWGPYCTNCLDEMPLLSEIGEELREKGLQIVGIESDAFEFPEDLGLARTEAAASGVTYPLLIADAAYEEQLRPMLLNALPGTWIVDSEGKVLDFVQGGKAKDAWIRYLEPYLAQGE